MVFTLGVVVADYHPEMTHHMLDLVVSSAQLDGHFIAEVVHVAGVYDMPLAVQKLLGKKNIQGVITLGVVLQGGTQHDMIVAENAAKKFVDLSCHFDKPVTCGVIGPRVSRELAQERVEQYALHAYAALITSLKEFERIE